MNIFTRKIRDWRNVREMKRRRVEHADDVQRAHDDYKREMGAVSDAAIAMAESGKIHSFAPEITKPKFSVKPYTPPFKDLVCPDEHVLAMDNATAATYGNFGASNVFRHGGFPGFPPFPM